MKRTILATAVAFALTSSFAVAATGHVKHHATANKPSGMTTGSATHAPGNNAELGGNNANSASGSNSMANPENLGHTK
jgi:hypothetical protein